MAARSNFSFLDGASHPHELVEAGLRLGVAGIGICDTNTLGGVVRAHVAAKDRLPFRVGCRLVLADGSTWLAWPVNRHGYGRLTALLSKGRMAEAGVCRISREAMFAAADGWVMAAVASDHSVGLGEAAMALRERLAMPLLLAVSYGYGGDDEARLDRWAALGLPLLAIGDVRFHHRRRRRLADVLSAIRLGVTVDALGLAAEPHGERALKAPVAMARLFARYPDAVANSLRVLEATAGFSLDQLRYEYPEEIFEEGRTPQETLAARVAAAMDARGTEPAVREQIAQELKLISKMGYAPYFLTVHEIVRFAREQARPILCQGRGSAANSAVCYVLGITALDPGKHQLLFDRFMSANRSEPPDIDIDFEHERREEVIQHLYARYGRDRAAICATVIRYRARSAIREVGKAMGLSADVTAGLAKASWGPGREQSFSELVLAEGLDGKDPRLAMAMELAEELQDFPRHAATHVGGFVITRGPLVELAVVTRAAMEDRTVLEWDKDDIEALGILKVDVLGLGMLSCLRRGFELMREHGCGDFDLASLPKECPDTYAMLRRADSVGVFQVESRAQMNMLPRLRPERFYDLVIEVAIVRPGPIAGDMVHPYLRRKSGLEKEKYPEPRLEFGPPDELRKVLGKTLGVPLFQEQAMRIAIVAAGFSGEEADQLRRAMATFKARGQVQQHRDKLVEGMVGRGYVREFAERVFAQIEGFGSYGFPESHAASFALLVYASAWMKRRHPSVFAAALLNSQPMGFYAPAQIVRDAREHGVTVRPVDVNASVWDCTLEAAPGSADELALRLGLRLVSGLSAEDGARIVAAREARNGAPFDSLEELARRAEVGKRALDTLAAANGFQGLGLGRRQAGWAARAVPGNTRDLPLFAAMTSIDEPVQVEPPVTLADPSEGESLVEDYRAVGLTLGPHPLALLRPAALRLGWTDTRALARVRQGGWIRLGGLVLMRQRPGTAKGVVFITIEDEFGVGNLVVYAGIATRDRAALVAGRLLVAEGRVERVEKNIELPIAHVIVRRLIDRSEMLDGLMDNSDWANRTIGRADEVRRPEPGLQRPKAKLPDSRDFR